MVPTYPYIYLKKIDDIGKESGVRLHIFTALFVPKLFISSIICEFHAA